MSKAKSTSTSLIMAICLVSLLGDCINGWNPIIDNVSTAFPDVSYTAILYVSTLPNLTCVIMALIAGAFVGKKLKYKTATVLGCLCILVSGVAPAFFYESFTIILVMRGVFGLGLGLFMTLSGYVCELFDGTERQRVLGLRTAALNTGSVVLLLLAGFLGDIYWPYASFSFLIAIVPLIAAIVFLKEPSEINAERNGNEVQIAKGNIKITPMLIVHNAVMAALTCIAYCVLLMVSTFLVERNLGGPAEAGIVLAVYTGGGILGGLIYEKAAALFKKFVIPADILIWTLCAAGIFYGGSLVVINIAAFIAGASWYITINAYVEKSADCVDDATKSFAGTLVWVAQYLGCFLSGYWIAMSKGIFGTEINGTFYSVFITFIAFAVITAIVAATKKENKAA